MSRATTLAQRPQKTGEFSPSYRLHIGGAPFASKLYDGTAAYSADGTSDMSINADADLSAYAGEKVRLEVGYGDEFWDYFGGWLEEPEENHWGGPASAVAYGPFKELAEATIGEDVSYAGYTLGGAIVDLHGRAGRVVSGTSFEIEGNPSYLLAGEEAGLTISTSFADGINTFLEMAGWVSVDRPGFVRRYRPRPRPRPSSASDATYSEAHYPPDAFKAVRGKVYGSVGAFARDDTGAFKWPPVKVRVDPIAGLSKPSALKTYWLEDFAGTEADAWLECAKLAALLSDGTYGWGLSGISANPELNLYDTIRVHTTELRDEGGRFKDRYAATYACAIDTEASVDISREGNPMNLSGETAIKLRERKLAKQFYVSRGTPSVVRV